MLALGMVSLDEVWNESPQKVTAIIGACHEDGVPWRIRCHKAYFMLEEQGRVAGRGYEEP